MPQEKNIINYTAADIEKYWKGKLSPAEMHTMEKAAMDDPFLADALEGYRDVNLPDAGLDTLKEKLDKRVGAFVPVVNLKRKRLKWIKAAAAIIIIVGAGLLVQQLFFNRNNDSIVAFDKSEKQSEPVVKNDRRVGDSIIKEIQLTRDTPIRSEQKTSVSATNNSYIYTPIDSNKKTDEPPVALQKTEPANATAALETFANAERKSENLKVKADPERTVDDSTTLLKGKKTEVAAGSFAKAQTRQANYEGDRYGNLALNNTFNYRVVDAQNNPVPFANVMNTGDKVGTYTDIRGNFNLVSTDSVVNVKIKSLGYNPANYKLVPRTTQPGDLILQEAVMSETVVQNRKVVNTGSERDSTEIEEPEVGWENYNTYIANNIQIPETTRSKNTRSEVELSFDIDKTGQPVNIKVIRSSQCKACDEEAKRLLKEGPKWKRKGKKSKATISIAVDQK